MDKHALAIIYQGLADDMLLTIAAIAERKTSKEAWGQSKHCAWVQIKSRRQRCRLLNQSLSR